MRVKLEAWKSVAFSSHVKFLLFFMVAAFVCVSGNAHGLANSSTQEMLEYLPYCRVGRTVRKMELQCSRKPCIDKPSGKMWPLY